MYGRTHEQWEQLRESAEYYLVTVAKTRGTTDYSTLNHVIAEENGFPPFDFSQQPGRDAIGQLLVEISEKTHAKQASCSPPWSCTRAVPTWAGDSTSLRPISGECPRTRRRSRRTRL
jgi:hypothetical protein